MEPENKMGGRGEKYSKEKEVDGPAVEVVLVVWFLVPLP